MGQLWFTRPLKLSGSKPCDGGSQIGNKSRQGKRQGQAAKQPDPLSWKCNARITKIKAQEGKDAADVRLYVLDTVDGHAQPDQYGCHHCRLGRGSARPFGCQAVRGWASSQDIGNRLGTGCKNISGSFFPLCCGQPSGRANPLKTDRCSALPAGRLVRFSGVGLLLKIRRSLLNDFIRFPFHIGGVFARQVFALSIETAYAEAEHRCIITAVPHFRTRFPALPKKCLAAMRRCGSLSRMRPSR